MQKTHGLARDRRARLLRVQAVVEADADQLGRHDGREQRDLVEPEARARGARARAPRPRRSGAKPTAGAAPASQTASSSRRPMRMPGPGPWKRTARVMCSPGRGTGRRFSQGRRASATMARMTRTPVQGTTPVGAYSPGIIAEGRFLYVSGQGPLIDGSYEPASVEDETRLTLENVGRILASAGAGFDDVVRCGVLPRRHQRLQRDERRLRDVLPGAEARAHDRPGGRAAGRHQGRDRLRGRPAASGSVAGAMPAP